MADAVPGRWEPLPLAAVVGIFASAGVRWWINGGRALELHLGRSWREHSDTDVGLVRGDMPSVRAVLQGWDLHVAARGRLSPWHGEPLDAARHQNNVWCRRSPAHAWALDLTIGDGSDTHWISRRDRSLRRPWDEAVLRSDDGVPYLAPELQLLFKSKDVRPKDEVDAREVIPSLDAPRRAELARLLPREHPWHRLLR